MAHQEAAHAPGYVHSLKGPSGSDGSCLSFCLWTSRAEARAASGGPAHLRAVTLLNEMYVQYALEFVRVARHAGGPLMFEAYDRPQPALPEPLIDVPPPNLAVRPAPAF